MSKKSSSLSQVSTDTKNSHAKEVSPVTSVTPDAVRGSAPITPPGDLPPAAGGIAEPPDGWVPAPPKGRRVRGLRPKGAQISDAVAAADELGKSSTYVEDFGSRAPAAAQVAFVVTNAAQWRSTWQASKRACEYAAQQRAVWENDAMAQMDALKPAFDYAMTRDASVSAKYAATAKYLGETNAIAARAASSRKAAAKAAAKGSKGAQGATAATEPAAPAAAAPEAATTTAK